MRKTAKRNHREKSYRKKSYRKRSYRKKSYRKKSYRKKIRRRSPANKRRTIHKKRLVGGVREVLFAGTGNMSEWLYFYDELNDLIRENGKKKDADRVARLPEENGNPSETYQKDTRVERVSGYDIIFGTWDLDDWGGRKEGSGSTTILGSGSNGIVYKSVYLEQHVCVKEQISKHLKSDDEIALDRFHKAHKKLQKDQINEIKILGIISGASGDGIFPHPNLNKMFALFIEIRHQVPLIGLELAVGGSLDGKLYGDQWKPTAPEVLGMTKGIFKGLVALHGDGRVGSLRAIRKIIHRDLKSHNIGLLTKPSRRWTADEAEKNVQILDFGLAKEVPENQVAEGSGMWNMTECGTPIWMAPEILLRKKVYNEKVDIYSMSMVMLEMVSGNWPWRGEPGIPDMKAGATACSWGNRPWKQLQKSRAGEDLKTFIIKCWDQAERRRPDAQGCIDELEKMLVAEKQRQEMGEATPADEDQPRDEGMQGATPAEEDQPRAGGPGEKTGGGAAGAGGEVADQTYDPENPEFQSNKGLPSLFQPKVQLIGAIGNMEGKCQMCNRKNKNASTTNCRSCGVALCGSCLSTEAKHGAPKKLKRWLCEEPYALVSKEWSKDKPNKKPCFRIESPNDPKFKGLIAQKAIEIVDETGTKKMVHIPSEGFDYGSFLITADEWEKITPRPATWLESMRGSNLDPPAKTLCLTCYEMKPREATSMWQMPNFSVLSPTEEAEAERKEELRESERSPVMNSEEMPDESRPPGYSDKFYKDEILDIWQRHAIRVGPEAEERINKLKIEEGMSMKHLFVIVNLVYEILETADPQAPPKIADEMADYLKAGGDGLSDPKINQEMDKLIKAHGY